ncbi:MAG: Flp pilus assembly protein CpaB [Pseudomonadota bacterium]
MAVNKRVVTMIVLAIGTGSLAVFGADQYLAGKSVTTVEVVERFQPKVAFRTIVAASQPLRFGAQLSNAQLTEIPWPEDAVPEGAFTTIDEVLKDGRRVVLTPIEQNEPVLKTKITGPGGRAGLANIISRGMRATTIRVNDVAGVAGFILPGDRVDVVWTRDSDDDKSLATVIQQNVRVLTIDQVADERAEDPQVVQAVTLEVDAEGAQRLTLASSTGNLSLILRRAGDTAGLAISSVSTLDLDTTRVAPVIAEAAPEPVNRLSTVWVTHADDREQFSVPAFSGRAASTHSAPEQ